MCPTLNKYPAGVWVVADTLSHKRSYTHLAPEGAERSIMCIGVFKSVNVFCKSLNNPVSLYLKEKLGCVAPAALLLCQKCRKSKCQSDKLFFSSFPYSRPSEHNGL